MSGSWRVFSSWSSAATRERGVNDIIGLEKTRLAVPPHCEQAIDPGAVPIGRRTSKGPCRSQRYS
jgi:hypothetical protein